MAFAPSPGCRFQTEIDKFWVVTAITDKEQEVALAKTIKSEDEAESKAAHNLMVESNLRLVVSIAKKFKM